MRKTYALQCSVDGKLWFTLRTRCGHDVDELGRNNHTQAMKYLLKQREGWQRQMLMDGHRMRIVWRTDADKRWRYTNGLLADRASEIVDETTSIKELF